MRLRDQVVDLLQHRALHADGFEGQTHFAFVEQAQHGALAMRAGQGRDAHVDRARAQAQADAAVLRQAFFGNVQLGHDFQARDQRGVQRAVGLHHFAQCAVHPKAHARMAFVGFDVDVAGAIARRLRQQGVEHADDGGVVAGLEQVFDRGQFLHHARKVGGRFHFADHRRSAAVAIGLRVGIGLLHPLGQCRRRQVLPARLSCTMHAQHLRQSAAVGFGAQPQRQMLAVVFQQQLVVPGKGVGQELAHADGFQGWRAGASPEGAGAEAASPGPGKGGNTAAPCTDSEVLLTSGLFCCPVRICS